jgi:hypothetical protein
LTVSGQENLNSNGNDQNHSPWSVSLSYSPHFAFSFNPDVNSRPYRDFLFGFNGRLDRKLEAERVTISFGVNFRNKIINHNSPDKKENVTLLEFPIQVNYHLKKTADKFDPYLKSSLRLNRIKSHYYGNDWPEDYIDYQPSIDIGYGSFIKIYKNLDLLLESCLGYGFTRSFPNQAYFDLLIGIKFNL